MFHTSRHSATQRGLTLSIGTLRSQNAVRASLFRRREHVPIAFHSSISTFDKLTPRDDRIRLSQSWAPSGGITETADEDAHAKLIRAGFLRQAHSGIFHVLPLGRRVQDKLEKLVDKHMSRVGASKLALSSISSEEIWAKSGRLDSGSELFHFRDRKDVQYLLSPTHEEEITSLVAKAIKSYKELPIRLYQISRKYRDELRPRHGVLRSREFVMKDLYTFDYNSSKALATYHQVRQAYADFFDELKIPYLVAEADSGDMGGNLSHEFHFPTSKGEDHIISCTKCDYVANEELAESVVPTSTGDIIDILGGAAQVWSGVTHDRRTLIRAWYLPSSPQSKGSVDSEINIYAIKNLIPDLDASVEDPELLWVGTLKPQDLNPLIPNDDTSIETPQIVDIVDGRLLDSYQAKFGSERPIWPAIEKSSLTNVSTSTIYNDPQTNQPLNLLRIKEGDACPRCSTGTLKVQKAIELGHTFHLGTRYSEPLEATVSVPVQYLEEENKPEVGASSKNSKDPAGSSKVVAMQMGCHGIGISRMIGAVADTLADERGLNWPRVMAPFEAVIVPGKDLESTALEVYDVLKSNLGGASRDSELLDVVLDDRGVSFPWKMRDADLVGYPVIVVVGRRWKGEGMCEVQCRRLGIKEDVPIEKLQEFVQSLLVQL